MILMHKNTNGVGKTIMTTQTHKRNNTGMVRSPGKLTTLGRWVVEHIGSSWGVGQRIQAPRGSEILKEMHYLNRGRTGHVR